jgi:hypothetical protein
MRQSYRVLLFYIFLSILATVVKVLLAGNLGTGGISAMIAIALFSGLTVTQTKNAFLLPLLSLLLSDAVVELLHRTGLFPFAGFYNGMVINYFLLLSVSIIGVVLKNRGLSGTIACIFLGPVFFFLCSNFVVWLQNDGLGYPRDLNGLMQCYIAGLPFFRNSLVSTGVFLPLFIHLYRSARKQELVPSF